MSERFVRVKEKGRVEKPYRESTLEPTESPESRNERGGVESGKANCPEDGAVPVSLRQLFSLIGLIVLSYLVIGALVTVFFAVLGGR
jgi:hypothetical protein